MGLRVFEGFDHYSGTATDFLTRSDFLQWTTISGNPVFSTDSRTGVGKSLSLTQATVFGSLASNLQTLTMGIGFKITSGILNSGPFEFEFRDGSTDQIFLAIDGPTASMTLNRGATVLWTSDNNLFSINAWHFLEMTMVIDNSIGVFGLRIDGQTIVSLGSIDTQTTANAWVNGIRMTSPGTSTWVMLLDDFYLNDDTVDPGPYAMNSYAGDVRCYPLFANGNNSVQWTPLANTNWQEISEVAFDGDTTYNSSVTAGQQDTFNYAALAATISNVIAVQVTGAYRKTVAGTVTAKQVIISGGTTDYGTTFSVPNGYSYFTDLWKQDPNGSVTWTSTAVNALKAGYNLVSI